MKTNSPRQYTIRNVPESVDCVLRQRARESNKSFNQVALEALIAGSGQSIKPRRDFRDIAGTLPREEAELLELEIQRQRQVDSALWHKS